MRTLRTLITAMAYAIAMPALQAQTDTARTSLPERVIGLAETVLNALTIEREGWSFAIYPAASYSGRTGLAVGIMPMLQLHSQRTAKPTTITPSALISTNRMFEVQCDADIYLRHGTDITAKAEFYYLPDKFYGIGNADKDTALVNYDIYRYMLTADALQRIGQSAWRCGISADVTYHKFSNADASLDAFADIQYARGASCGVGAVAAFDARDNTLAPTQGWYIRAKALAYGKALGGDHTFGTATLDARRYLPLGNQSVLAMQAYYSAAWGDAPFHKLPTCGGTRLGRAIPHNYKYIDRHAWLVQSEARLPVYWRIGATAFVAVGNVAHKFDKQLIENCHLMAGGGLRFKVFPSHGLNLRLDAGISSRGDHAIYFNIREAF